MGRFTERAQIAINLSSEIAAELGHNYVGTEHLLLGLLKEGEGVAAKTLISQNINYEDVYNKIKEVIVSNQVQTSEGEGMTPRVRRVLELSLAEATKMHSEEIGTEHILIALLRETDSMATRILEVLGGSKQKIYHEILKIIGEDVGNQKLAPNNPNEKKESNTPVLDQFSRDLTQMAKEGKFDPIIGRDKEIERIIQILSRRTKNNPCLIGEPGVGKTAIAEGLAQKIIEGNIPETIKGKRVVALDLSSMVAGSKYRGEFEDRIKKAIAEILAVGNVLLFIDEIHTIVGAGAAEGAIDASNILKPSLARGEVQLIGATTLDEYRKHIEKDPALERRFQPVKVDEPSEEEAIGILRGLKTMYEEHHQVKILDIALVEAVKLSNRYISDRFLPDKAIDVIDEASSKVRLSTFTAPPDINEMEKQVAELEDDKEKAIREEAYEKAGEIKRKQNEIREKLIVAKMEWEAKSNMAEQVVGEKEVASIIANWTGIPIQKLTEEEGVRLKNLEKVLHERVVGQEDAIVALSKAIRRGRVGLKDPKRPIGSFLFLGPTGVGKTELTKALAEALFGDENALIRVDMSEYMEKHSVSKLIGSPPGYIGYDEGGQLSEKIRRKPYSVLLFDEVEKAHPDVFNVLLQVLDDGHITDSQGRRIDFKNTVVIMTSNAGARNIISPKRLGFASVNDEVSNYKSMQKDVMDEVKKIFKPEFLNRIDETIVFHSLTRENIREIVGIMFNQLAIRMEKNLGIKLFLTEGAIDFIAKEGFDEAYGARPLRRAIQQKIEDQLAQHILDGAITEGDWIDIDIEGDALSFKPREAQE
ncbi:class III stress response-related ATPase, AAA+ superfamily [Petrocella atlantisensis]|uniref:Class III stress response-related ATPase, AAA+ superfamily n=1 Tax=Petrocella atlantisensis TaxID=2173034 RepID=A0A3P7PPQ5_9FIRM|nr:ATP-dependent Clp protease ATP-binding subunit [Petrocella atlantisensis]VDN46427.1 class III stress response-related ATPase, AAA+ superfamily [Petrocella atlantisensis]